jgi:ribonuclease HI
MNKYRCVLYVDGGCLPNPGSWGSGIHGYVYNIEEHDAIKAKKYSDKPNGRIMTTDGYKLAFDTKFEDVIPEYYINGYVSSDLEGTNNIAELTAIVESIKYILSNIDTIPIREVLFKTDSEYCIAVCNNIIKNDNKAVDNTRPNYAYWVKIAELLTQLKDNNITFNITYVKGHSDSLGNHLADRLATMGRVESAAGNNCVDIQITPAKGYWKYTNPVRHPFLQYRQLYFLNTLNIPGVTT